MVSSLSGGSRLVVGAGLVAAVLGGLIVLSSRSISPEQRLADAEPPPAATVDFELEQRVLRDTVRVRGQVAARGQLDVVAPGLAGGADDSALVVAIVRSLPYGVGEQVPPGGVVAVVSDRPVMVVPMSLPMHRTLTPGVEGPDVDRLQRALDALGYRIAIDGEFGPGTQDAVRRLYEDRGFEPLTTGSELDEAVASAEDAVTAAGTALQNAESTWNAAVASADQQQLRAAEQPLADAQSAYDAAASALADARAKVGVVVPLGELVGVAEFPVVVSQLPVAVGQPASDGAVAVLSPSDLVVEAQVDESRSAVLQPGVAGRATVEGEEPFDVAVLQTGTSPGAESDEEDGSASSGISAVFAASGPIDSGLLGKTVVIDVELAASDGEVLAVPIGAVRTDGDGEYLLLVSADQEDPRRVGFTPGLSVAGWVEVTEPDFELDAGDLVRAG